MEKLMEIRAAIELKKESLPPEAFGKISSSLSALELEICSFPPDDSLLVFLTPSASSDPSDLMIQSELFFQLKKIISQKEWKQKWACYMAFYDFLLTDRIFDYLRRLRLLLILYLNISELKRSKVPRSKEDDVTLLANQFAVLYFL